MTFTVQQYEELKALIASGEESLRYEGRMVQFSNIESLKERLALMEAELFPRRHGKRTAIFDKGL